jgi:DDE superfamily endonuclease
VSEIRAELPSGTAVEVWFQDEMRVGQKNKLTYRWARKGSRPRAIHDQRTQSTYLFGAVCPQLGTGAALVQPACNTEAMQLHLDEIGKRVSPGAHAILILDQAGWHGANDLKIPVHAAELAVKPHLQIFRRYRRPLLLRLEYTDRSAVENHVRRSSRVGNRRSLIVRFGITHTILIDKFSQARPWQFPSPFNYGSV